VILVAQDIADAAHLFPGDLGREFEQWVGNVARGFGNDLDTTLDAVAQKPVVAKIIKRLAARRPRDAVERLAYLR